MVDSSVITGLTKADIDAIVAQKNLLVRNLQITQGYHEVALMLGHFLGFENVNWFAFGTYASKTAGRAIRHESLPRRLKSALIRSAGYENTYLYLDHVLAGTDRAAQADNKVSRVLEQVSMLLSLGNLLIFGELAWPFVHLVNRFGRELEPNQAQFTQFLDEHFTPGSFDEGGAGLAARVNERLLPGSLCNRKKSQGRINLSRQYPAGTARTKSSSAGY